METAKMRNSVTMVLLMVMSTFAAIEIPRAEASEVVLTDAIQIVNGGSANDRMVATDADSMGNVHFVWSRNTQHLWYQMHNPRGDILISETQISNPGAHRAWHPDISVDSDDNLHITWTDKAAQWTILYTMIDPSQDDQSGDAAIDSVISIIDDFEVSVHTQNRDWPAIDTDSENNAHIVWEDSFEPLDKFYQQPQIYYSMIQPDLNSREAVVAVGETGLDHHYDHSPRQAQADVFAAHVALANEREMPIVIHTREAWEETFALLDTEGVPERTVFHCFTGGPQEAVACVERGAMLSFSGIITFATAHDVREAAARIPLEQVMVETDSPYLTPVPHRGKPNEPANVALVGAALAEAMGLESSEVAIATSGNARRFYGLGDAAGAL